MSYRATLPALCVSLLSGCAQLQGIPSGEPFADASIRKAKSAQHWDVIAADVAAQTKATIQDHLLYVDQSDGGDFSRGFRSFLISRLVNSGVPVVTKPEGAYKVSYETQVVRHADDREDFPRPGVVSALTAGVLVVRGIGVSSASAATKFNGVGALAVAADLGTATAKLHRPTMTEVVVTTSITAGNRYLMRRSEVYYVEDAEGHLFEPGFSAPAKTMAVVSK